MKRKIFALLGVALVLCAFLSVPALADDGSGGGILGGIFSGINSVWNFIKGIFVPPKGYFPAKMAALSQNVNNHFGAIGHLYSALEDLFSVFKEAPSASLKLSLPNNLLFRGYRGISVDVFAKVKPFITFFRGALTSFFTLAIGISCYHKVRTFFNEQE